MTWYSIDVELSVVERGIADKEEAMCIIEEYSKRGNAIDEYGEEALAATTFGFQKSEVEFVEICFCSAEEISFTYEISVPKKLCFLRYAKIIRKEKNFRAADEVKAVVSSFFDMDSEVFQRLLDRKGVPG